MADVNKIMLTGMVGTVNKVEIENDILYNFSLCVNNVYKSSNGTPVIQTDWFNCKAYGKNITGILEKGKQASITGEIHQQRYIGSDSIKRSMFTVIADKVVIK